MDLNPLILALETATLGGSVCLARGTRILSSRIGDSATSHSNSLLRDVEAVLQEASSTIDEVDAFAVAVGPGSFTGLRIGLATTKALAATLKKPCIGIPTLNVVAAAAGPSEATLALLPAGRGEVFVQLFSVSLEGMVEPLDRPAHVTPQKVFERYHTLERVLWAGEGALVHRQLIIANAGEKSFLVAPTELNLARFVVALAQNEQRIAPEYLAAIYVRPSDAELKKNVLSV